jgi:hypothetical protein
MRSSPHREACDAYKLARAASDDMIYDVAKRLKEEGFPQGGSGSWIGPPSNLVWLSGQRVYVPTFEELLAACGDVVQALTHERSQAGDEWVASSFDATGSGVKCARAPNPIEAVARLWLAVHANSRATD